MASREEEREKERKVYGEEGFSFLWCWTFVGLGTIAVPIMCAGALGALCTFIPGLIKQTDTGQKGR